MIAEIEKPGEELMLFIFVPILMKAVPTENLTRAWVCRPQKILPDIDLSKAIMIGNTGSDMQFGRNLGIKTIFLPTTRPEVDLQDSRIDAVCSSLISFADELKQFV